MIDATNAAATGVTSAAAAAKQGVDTATAAANSRLDPYATAGAGAVKNLSDFVTTGDGSKTFSGVDLSNDPGYKFRLEQGQKALERSAAARGSVMGGGAVKATIDYAGGSASSEFGAAFDRFERGKKSRFDMLSGLSDIGKSAATTQGANEIGAGKYGGDVTMTGQKQAGDFRTEGATYAGNTTVGAAKYTGDTGLKVADTIGNNTLQGAQFVAGTQIGAGSAQAQGIIGRANAWNGMLSGIGAAGDSAIAGGFGGAGGGFNLKGFATGVPQGGGNYSLSDIRNGWSGG